ncbi:hypothetical protein VSDG_02680 [Cytospora chrysosperma]|uniref:ACB domain-containing protein n=1 Tax=Cytospora chrysosperma TaxID=252740 RepID=A0A423WCW6_CYTCH|nr:hypothetical protein VSDG_02680 [Valsa sordida]
MSAFETAVADSKKLTSKPSNEELLDLYALYKIALGEDISNAPAPGMFDLKGKAKKNAWQKKVDEGVTQEQAKSEYVALVEQLKAQHGYDANKVPEAGIRRPTIGVSASLSGVSFWNVPTILAFSAKREGQTNTPISHDAIRTSPAPLAASPQACLDKFAEVVRAQSIPSSP